MNKETDKHNYKDRKYNIVSYDDSWPVLFEEYKSKLNSIFKDSKVEHIGSTSILDMNAKPCIDILVIVKDLKYVESKVEDMKKLGFEYRGRIIADNSLLFRIMEDSESIVIAHFFLEGHSHISEMINFRNYLKTHNYEAMHYASLKKDLYLKYPDDYASYRKYKDEYVEELTKKVSLFYNERS